MFLFINIVFILSVVLIDIFLVSDIFVFINDLFLFCSCIIALGDLDGPDCVALITVVIIRCEDSA